MALSIAFSRPTQVFLQTQVFLALKRGQDALDPTILCPVAIPCQYDWTFSALAVDINKDLSTKDEKEKMS
nr:hypothetical protein CFP56_27665 [Quercus suber]